MGNGHPSRHGARRIWRTAAWVAASLLVLIAALAISAPMVVRGPRLGRLIERNLPAIAGTIHVGGGTWTWTALWKIWRGHPGPFALDDVQLIDPEGTEVLRARHLTGALQVDRQGGGPPHVGVHALVVQDAVWRFARMKTKPQIGFLAALSPRPLANSAPRPSPANRAPATMTTRPVAQASGQPTFKIFDARLEGLTTVFDFVDWELTLKDVRASGSLAYDVATGARPVFTFDVANADVRAGGHLAVRVRAAQLTVPFTRAWLNHVATGAMAPDEILLSASPVMVAGSRASFSGRFTGVYANGAGRPPPPGMEAEIAAQDAVPAVRAVWESLGIAAPAPVLAGDAATLGLRFSGAFAALAVAVTADGFDVRQRGFELRNIALRASAKPAGWRARVTELTALSPGGGTVSMTGALEQRRAQATFTFRRFALASALPPALRTFTAGTLDGVLEGEVALAPLGVTIGRLTLALTRPRGVAGPPVVRLQTSPSRRQAATPAGDANRPSQQARSPGRLSFPAVRAALWGGALTVRGTMILDSRPILDVTVDGRALSMQRIVGSPLVGGGVSFSARIGGTLDHLSARVHFAPETSLRLFGERFSLPNNYVFALAGDRLELPVLRLQGGHGGALTARGKVGFQGLDLDVGVQSFPFDKLPAFADSDLPLAGQLTGQVHLTGGGPSDAPLGVNGQLSLAGTTYKGRPLGSGALVLTAGRRGALNVRGTVIDGVALDGTLTPTTAGLAGDAVLALRELVLDPFLIGWPGHLDTTGVVSGVAKAHMEPGAPPTIEGHFGKLALTVTAWTRGTARGRGGAGAASVRPPQSVEIHADEEVVFSSQPARGTFRLKPVRFLGGIGAIQVGGAIVPGETRATVRGRLSLPALSQLAPPAVSPTWLGDLAGNLDVDLEAIFRANQRRPVVTGSVKATARASVRLLGKPLPLELSGGRIDLSAARGKLQLPLTLAGSAVRVTGGWTLPPLAPSATLINKPGTAQLDIDAAGDLEAHTLESIAPSFIRNATGSAHFKVRVTGTPDQPRGTAQVALGGLSFLPPGLRADRVCVVDGEIDATEGGATVRGLRVQMGTRARLTIGGSAPARVLFAPAPGGAIPFALTGVDVPVEAEGISFATPTSVVDDVRVALRLHGHLPSSLVLGGDVALVKARVYTRPRNATSRGAAPNKSTADLQRWLRHPAVQQMRLDLRVRSRGGAITVDVPYAPDVRVDVDYQVHGTAGQPRPLGDVRSAGIYSALALSMYRLFK